MIMIMIMIIVGPATYIHTRRHTQTQTHTHTHTHTHSHTQTHKHTYMRARTHAHMHTHTHTTHTYTHTHTQPGKDLFSVLVWGLANSISSKRMPMSSFGSYAWVQCYCLPVPPQTLNSQGAIDITYGCCNRRQYSQSRVMPLACSPCLITSSCVTLMLSTSLHWCANYSRTKSRVRWVFF